MKNHTEIIKTLVTKWAEKYHVDLTDTYFYSPEEWSERKEEFCNMAVLVMTTEGELCEILEYGSPITRDSFYSMVEKAGYVIEQGYIWMFGFYRKGDL